MKNNKFSAIITKGEIAFVSYCPEFGIASQGKTKKDALKNLKEAVELFLEEATHSKVIKSKPLITTFTV